MSRRVRLVLLATGGLAILAILGAAGLYWAATYEPAFYRNALATDAAVLEKASDDMLRQTTAFASLVKKEGHWEALFTAEQVNGWLAVDLVKNHPDALPPTMHDPRVIINARRITLACRFQDDWIQSVLSLTIEPSSPEPNVVALRIVKARAGLLPAPLGQVLERIKQAAVGMGCRLEWRHQGADPVAMLIFPKDAKQSASIEALRLGDGELYIAGNTKTASP